jgi:type II secretory pathway predicted ATPase ExeA
VYESFYGLKEKPFALTPDPQFLFLARPHRRALTQLEFSLSHDAAFCLITGEVGYGTCSRVSNRPSQLALLATPASISAGCCSGSA